MRIHHLNCGTIQGLSVCGKHLVCHCLLIETPSDGLVLVDTGLGTPDFVDPAKRLGKMFTYGYARPKRDPGLAALAQVRRLGFDPRDVRNIVMTHLDLDHVGGLVDFPHAKVHTHAIEYGLAMTRPDLLSRKRYAPRMFEHGPLFRTYAESGESWFGFDAVRQLEGLPPEILLVPTFGHTRGHTAVAIQREDGWMLHAGDAYFDYREVKGPARVCTPLLRTFQFFNETDRRQRLHNQDRLRQLIAGTPDVQVFSAHNPFELEEAVESAQARAVD
ncbi:MULTISPECIES: MBL fold metallo-hydrolase [unclassified Pseudomonas]|uniref:MBL fold metallo-hydrolase n=1 Tax=unclassified Pseudomonas TaxID=196821 RepID=UPI000731BFA4|nr:MULTISPECIES: MBL fold metallo-hydrolase [unclassified Pseudomonas]KSW25811.1 hypothetical protein AOX63_19260 [Pseudomonas sp. ADP]OBP12328.1 hypothetical protein BAE52_04980 [Pseudomonas sp. EGD-AKN5]QOF82412.1 MBL fold metallo-hydrolase [Pseudomonas sp. ADPe]GLU42118.1 MBL fold metallo-hydrolase [Pseudomonas sp. NBRC 100443]